MWKVELVVWFPGIIILIGSRSGENMVESERELEVLNHIAEGLTNWEIAARQYLSLNTVKVHTSNIFGKLGVNNRKQAVASGRALGILPSI